MYKGLLLEVQRGLWDLKYKLKYLERCHCQNYLGLLPSPTNLMGLKKNNVVHFIWYSHSINDYETEPVKVKRGFRDPEFK